MGVYNSQGVKRETDRKKEKNLPAQNKRTIKLRVDDYSGRLLCIKTDKAKW